MLSLAAALETGSSHPLAVAILARAKADERPVPPATGAKAVAGKGVTGKVGGDDAVPRLAQAAADERVALAADADGADRRASTTRARPSRSCSPATRSPA